MKTIKDRTLWLAALAVAGTLGTAGDSPAQTRNTHSAEAAYDCHGAASFTLSSASGELNDTVSVYISADVDTLVARKVQITFTWSGVASNLTYIGLDTTGFGLDPDSANFRDSLYNDTLRVLVDGNWAPRSFDGDTIFAVLFRLECMPVNNWQPIPIVGGCNDDRTFVDDALNQTLFGVIHNDGKARIKPLSAQLFMEASVNALPRDTAKLVVAYTANFGVDGGYVYNCSFDTTELTYVGFTQTGYASAGHTLTDTLVGNQVRIRSAGSDALPADTGAALLGVLFRNETTADSTFFQVSALQTLDTMYMCSEAYAVNNGGSGAYVITPVFSATYDIMDETITEGNSGVMDIRFINTHKVDMKVNSSVDTAIAAFTIDADEFDAVTVAPDGTARDVDDNGSDYRWMQLENVGSGRRAYREDDGRDSDHMKVHTTATTVAGVAFTASQVSQTTDDWQFFEYTTNTQDGLYKEDCQLKALHLDLIIRPDANLGDNHITLDSGKIRVVNSGGGGGGSCPFVYTWNGAEFVLEDVILTQSEKLAEGTPVSDLLPLTYEPALVDGAYRFRIHEQEAEKAFLDHVELVMFDHAPGYDVSIDQNGRYIFGKDRLLPSQVTDDLGQDVLAWLSDADQEPYVRSEPGWLIATFTSRSGVGHAIAAADEPKPPCKLWAGPVGSDVVDPFVVGMEVQDRSGVWRELPKGPMRLPLAHARPIISLSEFDLGQTFQVRYTWDDHIELDELSLVVQSAVEHAETRAPLARIVHSGDHSSAKALYRLDDYYTELVTGEYVELTFPAEPVAVGKKRSMVLAAQGYYLTWYGEPEGNRPLHFGLNGNYPNPFNAATTIRYSLAAEVEVTLEIYNVLGQKVRSLISCEQQTAGAYEVTWDGRDEQGRDVASGAYLSRLAAGEYIETRKLMMLK